MAKPEWCGVDHPHAAHVWAAETWRGIECPGSLGPAQPVKEKAKDQKDSFSLLDVVELLKRDPTVKNFIRGLLKEK